jgi:hypothetical protein
MKITDLFIKRPVLALVVNFAILIAGFQSIHVTQATFLSLPNVLQQRPRGHHSRRVIVDIKAG